MKCRVTFPHFALRKGFLLSGWSWVRRARHFRPKRNLLQNRSSSKNIRAKADKSIKSRELNGDLSRNFPRQPHIFYHEKLLRLTPRLSIQSADLVMWWLSGDFYFIMPRGPICSRGCTEERKRSNKVSRFQRSAYSRLMVLISSQQCVYVYYFFVVPSQVLIFASSRRKEK